MEQKHKIYASCNKDSKIVLIVFSDVFIKPNKTDIEIESGYGDEFVHVQGKYQIVDENGFYNYKIESGKLVERTAIEKLADAENERILSLYREMRSG